MLRSAQQMNVPMITEVAFSSENRVREVIHNSSDDGFDSLYPKYSGGRPPKFTLPERQQIKKIALSRPTDLGRPFSTWSLTKLADHLVREGVVDDISHEDLRLLLREESVSFRAVTTWKESNNPDFEARKDRILEFYAIADGTRVASSNGRCTVPVMMTGACDCDRPLEIPGCQVLGCRRPNARKSVSRGSRIVIPPGR